MERRVPIACTDARPALRPGLPRRLRAAPPGARRQDARALADGQWRVRHARPSGCDPDHRPRRDGCRVPPHRRRGDAAARHPRAGRPAQGGQPAAAGRRARQEVARRS